MKHLDTMVDALIHSVTFVTMLYIMKWIGILEPLLAAIRDFIK